MNLPLQMALDINLIQENKKKEGVPCEHPLYKANNYQQKKGISR